MSERKRDQDGERDAGAEAPDRAARKPGRNPAEAGRPDGLEGQRSKGERPGNHRPR